MRILLLSFYYPPDIGPGPLRAKSIVDALFELDPDLKKVDVISTMPNRYHSLDHAAQANEECGQITIKRIPLPAHQSGMLDQAKAFFVFALSVLKLTRNHHWDIVIATSSRLMTAVLGAWVSKRKKAKLYLDIRDLFTDTMEDVLAQSPMRVLLPIFRGLEKWTFRAATQMNVVSAGFLPHLRHVAPQLNPSIFTNGIDDEFLAYDFTNPVPHERPLIVYAGNMGEGQGLHRIIPDIAQAMSDRVCFRLIGDGGRKRALQDMLEDHGCVNVEVVNPVPRQDLFSHYRDADVLFLHLNNYKAFYKVLPSKIFEYAATGKPILAGVAGYAADFLRQQVPGIEVFEPCDVSAMRAALEQLLQGPSVIDRSEFCEKYRRHNLMREMGQDILSL